MHLSRTEQAGYNIINDVIPAEVCRAIRELLSSPRVERGRAGARHLMSVPEIAALANDLRPLAIAEQESGKSAIPFRATLFDKSDRANWLVVWHQDTALPLKQRSSMPGWGPWSVKAGIIYAHAPHTALSRIIALRLHLDPCTNDNGPLRVVPHSHSFGVLSDEEIESMVRAKGVDSCEVAEGGVLTMKPLIIHASSKALSSAPRRVLHIEYTDSLSLEPGIELAVA